jgi:hypothetical protein
LIWRLFAATAIGEASCLYFDNPATIPLEERVSTRRQAQYG